MSKELDQSASGTGTSESTPATATVDTDAIVAALEERLNPRFSGIATLIDSKVSPLAAELNELKNAGLSEDEREQLANQSAQQRLAELERRNALLELRRSDPESVDFMLALEDANSFEDQLAVVKAHFGKAAAEQVEAAAEGNSEAASSSGPVDRNNPARPPAVSFEGEMNDELADQVLKSAGRGAMSPGPVIE